MDKKLASVITVISLLTAAIAIGGFTDADAYTKSTKETLSPKSFGSKTNVCGDKLCSERITTGTLTTKVEVIDTYPLSGDYYKILIKVTSYVVPLFGNVIYVTSDADTRVLSVPFIKDNSYDYATTTIRAFEESSIKVVYLPSNAVSEIDADIPYATLSDVSNISENDSTFRVIFDVTTKDFNAKNIKVQISSDIDTITYSIGGLFEDTTNTNQVMIKAVSPESISVNVVDYEINR
ncbi:MAG: hypothetical protein KC483_06940 [Nitrosarchaeum sp.]|nr:hypothetical protein [Nitrosarchaeum sp.]